MKLYDIKDPAFLKQLSIPELETLSGSIRAFLVEKISKTGGHLSSNLGVVELTVALHAVFDSPRDALIFDVGHQSYTHKILTGRAGQFDNLRQADGMSGFLKRSESPHDVFEAGHSSTSLAAGAGILFARTTMTKPGHVVMLIGDGALASGMALESLNFMGHDANRHPIIVINDNEMSISQNIGHMSRMLSRLRMKRAYRTMRRATGKLLPGFLKKLSYKVEKRLKSFISGQSHFEDIGYSYFGPFDGHDFKTLLKTFRAAKQINRPCVIHVRTEKGKGYAHSENDADGVWHGVGPFEIDTGFPRKKSNNGHKSYSEIVAEYLIRKAEDIPQLHVITPAMLVGSGLTAFHARFGTRLIDVGIAEQTAVTMATGMALEGLRPFLSIYSTFLQRGYDQLLHDLARHDANVILGVDRAGIVGGDGETHQGIYDIPMMAHIPNMTIAHPKDPRELYGVLNYAFNRHKGPIAIRYSRADAWFEPSMLSVSDEIPPSWNVMRQGTVGTIISFGTEMDELLRIIEREQLDFTLVNARYLKPLDGDVLDKIDVSKPMVVAEESTLQGGLGAMIAAYYVDTERCCRIRRIGFDDVFVPQGDRSTMLKRYGLDAASIVAVAKSLIHET